MQVKLFELRDRMTFMPVMAIRLFISGTREEIEAELFLLRRAGYAAAQILHRAAEPYIVLCKLDGVEAKVDPWLWDNQRTLAIAHRYMIETWNDLKSGDLIDVEFILGEKSEPKKSERYV